MILLTLINLLIMIKARADIDTGFSKTVAVNSCLTKASRYQLAKKLVTTKIVTNIKEARKVVELACSKRGVA